LVSLRKIESSARNCLKGKIIEITDRGQLIQLKVKAGPVFTVLITRASFEEMKLTLGKSVYLTFKTTSLNVFG
jgi:molybdate/tungstate transport system ATP-binding protein